MEFSAHMSHPLPRTFPHLMPTYFTWKTCNLFLGSQFKCLEKPPGLRTGDVLMCSWGPVLSRGQATLQQREVPLVGTAAVAASSRHRGGACWHQMPLTHPMVTQDLPVGVHPAWQR